MEKSTNFTQSDMERLKKLSDERSELRKEGLLKKPKPALKTEQTPFREENLLKQPKPALKTEVEHIRKEDLFKQPKSALKREKEHAITKAGEMSLDPLATPGLAAEVKQEPDNPEKSPKSMELHNKSNTR